MDYVIAGIGTLIIGGFVSLLLPEKAKGYIIALCAAACLACLGYPAVQVLMSGKALTAGYVLNFPIGTVNLVVDRLSAFFILVIASMCFVGALYAIGYMKPYAGKKRTVGSHFFFLSLLIASMLLVVTVQNALAFLICWEVMSLSSFFLVAFENEKEEVYQAGINYLIAMHIGVIFLITAFVLVSVRSGSLDFASFQAVFAEGRGIADVLFFLFFIGFGMKAGFMPLHTWLPKAHPAAPSHISGLMSGVMIKTGIYGILRVITLMKEPPVEIAYFVLVISVISGILGVAYAIAQHNIKRLLAYHSVENIGIIGIGIGLGLLGLAYKMPVLATLGFTGGILHVLNHSIFKSLLFYSAGGVYQQTHLLDIEKLGGLIKPMLFTGVCFLLGSLAISGLPPFNGFVSEFFIYWGMLSAIKTGGMILPVTMIVSFAGLAFIGALALLCFTKVFSIVFLGFPRSEYHDEPREVSLSMKTAMGIQVLMILAIGFLPQYVFAGMTRVVSIFTGEMDPGAFAGYFNLLVDVSRGLALFTGIFALVYIFRTLLLGKRSVYRYKTWDCGYQAGNTRMQYTASSYAAPLIRVISPIFQINTHLHKPQGLFPTASSFESHTEDKFEHAVVEPVIAFIQRVLNAFTWIQSGSTQQYIMYGLLFLIAITFWIMVI